MNSTLSLLLSTVLLAGSAAAQFDREMDAPTDSRTFFGYSPASISTLVSQGYRLSDIEVVSATANTIYFSGTAVRNTGDYQSGWWWYYGVTPLQLLSYANQNGARLIDVERYVVGNTVRYAGLMLANSGRASIDWYLWTEVEFSDLAGLLSATNSRIIDLEHHEVNGQDRMTVLAIKNQGSQARTWYYYVDTSFAFLASKVSQLGVRPIDLERIGPNRWSAVLVDDGTGPWWWYYGVSASFVLDREDRHLARTFDLERYLDGGTPRYAALMMDNFENFQPYGTPCSTNAGPLDHDVVASSGFKGTTVHYRGRNMVSGSVGVMHLGIAPTDISLAPLGLPGCSIYTDPVVAVPFAVPGSGQVIVPIAIPNVEALVGAELFTQFAAIDQGNQVQPIASSNGVVTTIRG